MIKNIKYFMHSSKLLYGFILFFFIPLVDNTAFANDFFSVDNINIDIISEDINLARKEATQKAILIGLEKLFSWKLSNKDYSLIILTIKEAKKLDIKNFVSGYKIQYEIFSNINYKAEFSVVFNLKTISAWLNSYNIDLYDGSDLKIISLNAGFQNFKNWRQLMTNLKNIDEITEYNILSISYDKALIRVSINIENEATLFKVFNNSRIDVEKRLNVHAGYNISLIGLSNKAIDLLNNEYKNNKKDSSVLLTE
ncbi:hypothetical protein OAC06_03710 [Alphaproteobacteria bacterium]|nr:hypothetical protein [Alphaproteobacteria bacterium]